eukprot:2498176-Amphidinium_carterae.3
MQAELTPTNRIQPYLSIAARELLREAKVIYFIDNEGVKESLASGSTRTLASKTLPSPSNIADAPSRLDFTSVRIFPVVPVLYGSGRCPTV